MKEREHLLWSPLGKPGEDKGSLTESLLAEAAVDGELQEKELCQEFKQVRESLKSQDPALGL